MPDLLKNAEYSAVEKGFRKVRVMVAELTDEIRNQIYDALHDQHLSVVPHPSEGNAVQALVIG